MTEMLSLLFNIKYLKGYKGHRGLPQWLSGKESACNVGDTGDLGLISELGRSPGGGHGTPAFLPGEIPSTEEPGGLQSMGFQRVGDD